MGHLLEVKNMNISFQMGERENHATKDLSFTLEKGEILSIVGASGSGKTVMTHALMGILPENAKFTGEMYYEGKLLTGEKAIEKMTLIPQTSTYLDPLMKVSKQVKLKEGDLSELSKDKYPFQCSGGMIRNVLMSLAYEKESSIILADEPTPGLDMEQALKILAQLKEFVKNGKSVILITHDIDLALNISDRVAVFREGTILEIAASEDFATGNIQNDYTRKLYQALPQNEFFGDTLVRADVTQKEYTADSKKELICKGVSFRYKGGKELFHNLDFSLREGEKVCVFAKSGFGKSTFAKILSGYQKPASGNVYLGDVPIEEKGYSPVQLVYQHPEKSVNPKWTVEQILQEGGPYNSEMLHKFGIDDSFLTRFPHELSGGELQRICIVRALKEGTKFLICDEITTMLDTINQANIWKCVLEEVDRKNIGLIVITHNLNLANKLCNRVLDFEDYVYNNS